MVTLSPASQHLASVDRDWEQLINQVGPCEIDYKPEREPFEALINAIAHQQLHARAAEAILKRFTALFPNSRFPSPENLLSINDAQLRQCGFSKTKAHSIVGVAKQAASGTVPSRKDALLMSDDELINRLICLKGVGRWTIEMILIYCLERPDILPVDDFGVREGWRILKSLDKQLTPKKMALAGLAWKPYRTTATWYLWRAVDNSKLAN